MVNVTNPSEKAVEEANKVMYRSRKITCIQCQHQNEIVLRQLRIAKGFRAAHCAKCGAQTLAKGLKCSCGFNWHLCGLHRTDPGKHKSRKAPNAEKSPEQTRIEEAGKSSKRKAPEAKERAKHRSGYRNRAERSCMCTVRRRSIRQSQTV